MKVGDLIGIGWSGIHKRPFVAVIKKIHNGRDSQCYTVLVVATGNETFITQRDVKPVEIDDENR